jgi:Uma2 family endonuclease
MTAQTLTPPQQIIQLSGISWETYENLLTELSHRRQRLTYNHGNLEIMMPSPEHELYKEILGRFIETLAEELEIKIYPLGSTTFQRQKYTGIEPDKCFYSFYIQNINAVQDKNKIDLDRDPPPDLVVEIDITSSSENRLQVYADIGVREVWIYNGDRLRINRLNNGKYIDCDRSLAFPILHIVEIVEFLQQAETMDYLELVRVVRSWIESEMQQIE